jgi:CHASE2 domain-containing sensor protein
LQQTLRAERPAWSVAATAVAVWGGAAGSLGLILRRRWATPLLLASLIAVIVQDFSLFVLGSAAADPIAMTLQGLVLLIAIGLVLLARKASRMGWLR